MTNTIRKQRFFNTLHFADGTCVEMLRSKTPKRDDTSGVTGVFRSGAPQRWIGEICFSLGSYVHSRTPSRHGGWEKNGITTHSWRNTTGSSTWNRYDHPTRRLKSGRRGSIIKEEAGSQDQENIRR